MTRAALLLLLATGASAQPADSTAARRPAWLTYTLQIGHSVPADENTGTGTISAQSLRYHRTVGPVVAEVGVSGFYALPFGGTALEEIHVAAGRSASVGPLLLTAAAGPSVGRAFSRTRGETVPVAGAFAAVEADLVFVPFAGVAAEAFVKRQRGPTGRRVRRGLRIRPAARCARSQRAADAAAPRPVRRTADTGRA